MFCLLPTNVEKRGGSTLINSLIDYDSIYAEIHNNSSYCYIESIKEVRYCDSLHDIIVFNDIETYSPNYRNAEELLLLNNKWVVYIGSDLNYRTLKVLSHRIVSIHLYNTKTHIASKYSFPKLLSVSIENDISDIDFLKSSNLLRSVSISGMKLTDDDVSFLIELPYLLQLSLHTGENNYFDYKNSKRKMPSIDFQHQSRLQQLDAFYDFSLVENQEAISKLTTLKELYLRYRGNNVYDLSHLKFINRVVLLDVDTSDFDIQKANYLYPNVEIIPEGF